MMACLAVQDQYDTHTAYRVLLSNGGAHPAVKPVCLPPPADSVNPYITGSTPASRWPVLMIQKSIGTQARTMAVDATTAHRRRSCVPCLLAVHTSHGAARPASTTRVQRDTRSRSAPISPIHPIRNIARRIHKAQRIIIRGRRRPLPPGGRSPKSILTLSALRWRRHVRRTPRDQLRGAPSRYANLVSCIDEMDSSGDSVGIDVPESLLFRQRRSPSCRTILASQ